MNSIHERFLQAEEDFISSARSQTKLEDFAERWQKLQSDWESHLHQADPSTRQLVDEVAARIEELTEDICVFQSRRLSLENDLLSSLEEAFASLGLEDNVIDVDALSTKGSEPVESPHCDHEAIYPAQWLLRNLHNPYPLPHVHFQSMTAGTKNVKDWFAKARQRIGWTRLLRDRFAGCRSLATDAAFRAFVRDDPRKPLDEDLKTAFLAIKSHAELVYGEDVSIPNPSPKRLRSISPTPSLTFSSGSEDTDDEQCPVLSSEGRFDGPLKRLSQDPSCSLSPKRRRIQSPSFPISRAKVISPACIEKNSSRPRKRRLSESEHDGSRPKRPRGMEGGRLHAASDPVLMITPPWVDFDQSFQIPNPASIHPLESPLFDLDFFNPQSISSSIFPSIPVPDVVAPPADFSSLFEIPQLDQLPPEFPTFGSDWGEFLNLDPDLSLFPLSPSLISSSASTPPLMDNAALSPFSPSYGASSSPLSVPDNLPRLNDKDVRLWAGEPMIQGQDFLLPPSETAGILSASTLLSAH